MRGFRKSIRKIALFLTCVVVLTVHADVKLRIYMQDGTLQAGNLISETNDTFVILTKEGRLDVPKKRIMFVNGKSLKQWEQKPDKLFSTEIIPSEIPNPAFVNERARAEQAAAPKISELAELKSVMPKAQSEAKPVQTQVVEKPKPTPTPSPSPKPTPSPSPSPSPKPSPIPSPKASPALIPTPTPAITPKAEQQISVKQDPVGFTGTNNVRAEQAAPKSLTSSGQNPSTLTTIETTVDAVSAAASVSLKQKRRRSLAPKEVAPAPAPQDAPESAVLSKNSKPAKDAASDIIRPKGFRREEMGNYHYQRGMAYLNQGERGRAIQELHMAVLLDRRREEPVYELGKLYKEEGQFEKAEKYFAHPVLRKKEEIKNWVQDIAEYKAKTKKNQLILNYGTGSSVFMSLVLFGVFRRLIKKRKVKKRVITADNISELAQVLESPVPVAAPSPINNRKEEIVAPLEPKPIEVVKPDPVAPPPPLVIPQPVSKPVTPPVAPPPPTPVMPEPVSKPTPPSVVPPVMSPVPTPEPVLIPEFRLDTAPLPSIEEVLTSATLVDEAMQRGNSFALEGDLDKARREYRTALALNPAHLDAHLGLAYLSFSQQQWDLSLEHYIRGLQINPSSPDVHYGIGRVMLELGRQDEAVPRFQAALKFDPTFEDARECLTSLGKAV